MEESHLRGMLLEDSGPLIAYRDFEGILCAWCRAKGHEFEFEGARVPPEGVFLDVAYAPALLAAGDAELVSRDIDLELAVDVTPEVESMFGSRLHFVAEKNSVAAQVHRLLLTMLVVEALPRRGRAIQLDRLQYVLRSRQRVVGPVGDDRGTAEADQ